MSENHPPPGSGAGVEPRAADHGLHETRQEQGRSETLTRTAQPTHRVQPIPVLGGNQRLLPRRADPAFGKASGKASGKALAEASTPAGAGASARARVAVPGAGIAGSATAEPGSGWWRAIPGRLWWALVVVTMPIRILAMLMQMAVAGCVLALAGTALAWWWNIITDEQVAGVIGTLSSRALNIMSKSGLL